MARPRVPAPYVTCRRWTIAHARAALAALKSSGVLGGRRPARRRCRAGTELAALIERLFADAATADLHDHTARPGCYGARLDRA